MTCAVCMEDKTTIIMTCALEREFEDSVVVVIAWWSEQGGFGSQL